MYKILFDSDALIKLSKTGILPKIVETFDSYITEEVYEECVIEGKKKLYKDAEDIEQFINSEKIKIIHKKNYETKKILEGFGKGETSVFQAKEKDFIIITDDLSFTRFLQKNDIDCLSSGHFIGILLRKKIITKNEANEYLERLKIYIKPEIYELIKKEIGGK